MIIKKNCYFLDRPLLVALVIAIWWTGWVVFALSGDRFIPPTMVSSLVFSFSATLLIVTALFTLITNDPAGDKNNYFNPLDGSKYPLFKIQLIFLVYFLAFICIPAILKDPFGYRMNTFFDHSKGIESVIFYSPFWQLIFELIYLYIPMSFCIISAFTGNVKFFKYTAILLIGYAMVTLSRGLYLSILMLYMLMPQRKKKLALFCVLIAALVFLIPDYIKYYTLGFSLLEKFLTDTGFIDPTIQRGGRFFTFGGLIWPVFSLFRSLVPDFFTDYEIASRMLSSMVDIGLYDSVLYNAFYTFLIAPIYDLGFLGPVMLAVMISFLLLYLSRIRSVFISRAGLGYLFSISMSGVQMNSLGDREIIVFIGILLYFHFKYKKQFCAYGENLVMNQKLDKRKLRNPAQWLVISKRLS